ncbi:hypothetical protein ZWY2020_043222 [Hordeum vulgare]|nr:hypothetical protein ZWY2020_043222 [Hordeum vulgare]
MTAPWHCPAGPAPHVIGTATATILADSFSPLSVQTDGDPTSPPSFLRLHRSRPFSPRSSLQLELFFLRASPRPALPSPPPTLCSSPLDYPSSAASSPAGLKIRIPALSVFL